MPTVTKTWAFASDAEGLADAGNSGVVFAFLGSDGNPSGCVRFTQATKNATQSEFARRSSTGETWETWGVPAGSTVESIQITAWGEKLVANTKLTSHSIKARIVGSGGSSVHSAGDLLDVALGTTTDASWQSGSAGSSRAVDSGSQASTTDVRLELEYAVVTSAGGGSASVDQRFDQIELTITYAAPGGNFDDAQTLSGTAGESSSATVTRSGEQTLSASSAESSSSQLNGQSSQTFAGTAAQVASSTGSFGHAQSFAGTAGLALDGGLSIDRDHALSATAAESSSASLTRLGELALSAAAALALAATTTAPAAQELAATAGFGCDASVEGGPQTYDVGITFGTTAGFADAAQLEAAAAQTLVATSSVGEAALGNLQSAETFDATAAASQTAQLVRLGALELTVLGTLAEAATAELEAALAATATAGLSLVAELGGAPIEDALGLVCTASLALDATIQAYIAPGSVRIGDYPEWIAMSSDAPSATVTIRDAPWALARAATNRAEP